MPGSEEAPPFEVLEHTADIGLLARGRTLDDLFENAIRGLIEIVGASGSGGPDEEVVSVELDEADLGGTLVDLLNEVIYRLDRRQARIAGVGVERDGPLIRARIAWGSAPDPPDGTELKAATYHQLKVEKVDEGYEARVFFDV
jgi:SHS2 domain-containing protein